MPYPGKTMRELASLVDGELRGDSDTVVTDVSLDSRRLGGQALFTAVHGQQVDGHRFVSEAAANGAVALCVSQQVTSPLPTLRVADTRAVVGKLAAAVHGRPSETVAVVGVTGTNGKTTVTFQLEAIATEAGKSCGLIGTVATRHGRVEYPNPHTTPEATDWQRLLAAMRDGGAEWIAAEVSSHALALDRVAETRFAVGAFTNLSQDHLDFHGGLEQYFAAKARLLEVAERRVIWVEDSYGARLASAYPEALTVGWNHPVRASRVALSPHGTEFRLHLPDGEADCRLHLRGRFNVANALVAAGCAHLLGVDVATIAAGLAALPVVPGRFEVVSTENVMVVVDYAHSPEGIATVIETARAMVPGRVIAVIGAGGDRDRGKRPLMGSAASAADLVVVTSDNPRNEDPAKIIDEVAAGLVDRRAGRPEATLIVDRRSAIAAAIDAAHPGDIVLILGKGHEAGQEIAGTIRPFSDQRVAREHLDRRARR